MGLDWWRSTAPGSARSVRRRELLRLQLEGKAGPTWWEVAPAFALIAAGVVVPAGVLGWLHSQLGGLGVLLGLVLLVMVGVPLVGWRRAVARRRSGLWTAAELVALDDDRLPDVVLTILQRDGWRVRAAPYEGQPRLLGRDRAGHRIDVTFRQAGRDAADTPAPGFLREAGRASVGGMVRLVVSRGEYSRADVRWAGRQGGVHLMTGHQLTTWAAGLPLQELVGLTAAGDVDPGQVG